METFKITRTFNAPRDLVWQVYTQQEHMAHWFGPKGFTMWLSGGGVRMHQRLTNNSAKPASGPEYSVPATG